MRIWIDIANAPHAPLFGPLATSLQERGHDLFVTAWDRGQARALATEWWPDAVVVGAGYRTPVVSKGVSIWARARALAERARSQHVDVALGHGSYSQVVAARLLRIPAVTMADYEHQPANHLSFRLARKVVLPEAISLRAVRKFGVTPAKLVSYEGFKEDVTLSSFTPSPGFRASLGLDDAAPLVVLRPPPEGALYHRKGNPGFAALLPMLARTGAQVLVTPRTRSQGEELDGTSGIRVLQETVSGADLLWHADLVIGAGGTMTREAAVLGTPSITIFSGKLAAVDRALISMGRLRHVGDVAELGELRVERLGDRQWDGKPGAAGALAALLDDVFGQVVTGARARRRTAPAGPGR